MGINQGIGFLLDTKFFNNGLLLNFINLPANIDTCTLACSYTEFYLITASYLANDLGNGALCFYNKTLSGCKIKRWDNQVLMCISIGF